MPVDLIISILASLGVVFLLFIGLSAYFGIEEHLERQRSIEADRKQRYLEDAIRRIVQAELLKQKKEKAKNAYKS